jgi:SAM-dependent methyltransferase
MSHEEITRDRFRSTAARLAEQGAARVGELRRQLERFLEPAGTERALDVGTGTGPLAIALAPLVREVVGVDLVPEMLAEARSQAGDQNVTFVEGDATALPFETASFDLTATSRTIHHVQRPELAIAEMVRVTRPGGRVVVIDEIASVDPLEALAQNVIERLRDPAHVRVLSDPDFRVLFEANWLLLRRFEVRQEDFMLDAFLALAGCEGPCRQAVIDEIERRLARGEHAGMALRREGDAYGLTLTIAWYLLVRQETPTSAI